MYKSAFYKQAGPADAIVNIGRGAVNAAKAFTNAAPAAKGLTGEYLGRLGAAKDGFKQVVDPGSSAYAAAEYLYNLPGRMFGPTITGKWGVGGGARWLGRIAGAKGHWTINPNTGKKAWHFTGHGEGATPRQRVADSLARFGTNAEAAVVNATRRGNAAANRLAANGHKTLGWLGRRTGGMWTGMGLSTGAALSPMVLGEDSTTGKVLSTASEASALPAMWLNPVGLAFNGAMRGAGWVGNKFVNMATDAAQQAATSTADSIADGLRDQGRMAFMYGAISPEAFAAQLRERARQQINDRFSAIRTATRD